MKKVLVLFASHRFGGQNAEIEEAMCSFKDRFQFDFVHLADHRIEGCASCHNCSKNGHCVLPQTQNDKFQEIYDKMVVSDAVFIISPVYAGIPSRLTALMERLTSVLFDSGAMNTNKNPLLGKPTAIFSYCSSKICDAEPIKVIFDKFVMKNYRFDRSTYAYLNCEDFKCYSDITEYVLKTLEKLY